MRKFFVICLLFLFVFPVKTSFGQENSIQSAYQNFTKDYRYYQSLVEPFNLSKSKYLSFNSVTSRAEYLEASKKLILAEINSLISFSLFVKLKLAEETKILEYKDSQIYLTLDDEISSLNILKEKVINIASVEENLEIWKNLRSKYLIIKEASSKSKSSIEIGKSKKIFSGLKDVNEKMAVYLDDKNQNEQNTKAARDKYNGLSFVFNSTLSLINSAETEQKNTQKEDIETNSKKIRSIIDKINLNYSNIFLSYDNIIETLK